MPNHPERYGKILANPNYSILKEVFHNTCIIWAIQAIMFISLSILKLAWYEWVINKDSLEYKRNMSYCILKGNDQIDEDKQAFELAKNKTKSGG